MQPAHKSNLVSLSLDALDSVSGGMRWEDFRRSDNVEDRRPESQGGPVPDADWQKEQDELQKEQEQEEQDQDHDSPEDNGGQDDGGYDSGGQDDGGGGYDDGGGSDGGGGYE